MGAMGCMQKPGCCNDTHLVKALPQEPQCWRLALLQGTPRLPRLAGLLVQLEPING